MTIVTKSELLKYLSTTASTITDSITINKSKTEEFCHKFKYRNRHPIFLTAGNDSIGSKPPNPDKKRSGVISKGIDREKFSCRWGESTRSMV